MAVLVLLACLLRLCHSESGKNPTGRSRAKVVEDYLLSADFNSLLFPQVHSASRFPNGISRDDYVDGLEEPVADNRRVNELMERDLVVHPPPPPAVVSPYSIFAIGFIGFLTLLATLQASLALMTTQKQGGLLGGLGKPAGRRRRAALPQ